MLLGAEAVKCLSQAHVTVFGVGGVGGYAVEVLARSGVGTLQIVDPDTVDVTNINRQILALSTNVGQLKVDVAERRIKEINPLCNVIKHPVFYLPESANQVDFSKANFVIDCIDTITAKIEIIRRCHDLGIPVITCLGAANKMDPTAFHVTDIFSTHTDPLARVMRKKLRALGIFNVPCVISEEQPRHPLADAGSLDRIPPASNAFVPAAEGIVAAAHVVSYLTGQLG